MVVDPALVRATWADLCELLLQVSAGTDGRGRTRLYIGKRHPYAQRSGYCWRSRFVVQMLLGRQLLASEHVHHVNGNQSDDRPRNFEVIDAVLHGRNHASGVLVAVGTRLDQVVELEQPIGPYSLERDRWLAIHPHRRAAVGE